jgi:hypothetical protein
MATAMAMAMAVAALAQSTQYKARLSMVPVDTPMLATVSGSGSATATLKGSTLTITGTFTGLKTAATVAHMMRSQKPGMRGTAIGELTVTADTSGTIGGSIELSKDQVADLAAGRLYIQLHSQKAPDGNLWGWLFEAKK